MVSMASLNIAILGDNAEKRASAAHEFGKKGSIDDIAFYHTVFQGKVISTIDPCTYPDKLRALLQAVNLVDYALVLVEEPTPVLGEIIVCLELLGLKSVFVTDRDLTPFISNTSLKDSKIFATVQEARTFLYSQEVPLVEGKAYALIDHCFDVKGVGTVALGVLKRGRISVHDTITAYPLGRGIEIKSIQKNDEDVKEVFSGDRFGFSIKNAKAGEVDRGTVLSANAIEVRKEFECEITVTKFYRGSVKNEEALHLNIGLQLEPVMVKCDSEILPGKSGRARIISEKPLALEENERMLLCNLNGKGLRVMAGVKPIK